MKKPLWPVSLGLLGVSLVWQIYNAYVPLFLQAGRSDFKEGAGLKGFGLGSTTAGFVMTLDNLAALLILPVVGAWSDRLGKRKAFIVVGAPLAALGMWLVPQGVQNLPLFMLGLALVILAMDVFRTPLTALLADLTSKEERSKGNGILMLGYGVGSVIAFTLGASLWKNSPSAPFTLAAVGMLAAGLLVALLVREPKKSEVTTSETMPPLKETLRNLSGTTRFILLASFFWTLGVSALEVFFTSFAVKAFSLDGGKAMMLMGFFGIAGILGAVPSGLLGTKLGRKTAVQLGLGLLVVLLPIVSTVTSLTLLRVMLVCMGLSWSLVQVNALPLALEEAPETRAGAFTGMFLTAGQLASVIGPVLSGWVIGRFGTEYRALFVYAPFMMACAWLLLSRLPQVRTTNAALVGEAV
ncbi:MAG: MFS transporter [Armatimonas sp.]